MKSESQRVLRETMTAILSNPELYDARSSSSDWAWFAIRMMPDVYEGWLRASMYSTGARDEFFLVSNQMEIPTYVLEYLIKSNRTIEELLSATAAFCDPITPADVIQMDGDDQLFAASRPDLTVEMMRCLLAPGPWLHEEMNLMYEVLVDNPYVTAEEFLEIAVFSYPMENHHANDLRR